MHLGLGLCICGNLGLGLVPVRSALYIRDWACGCGVRLVHTGLRSGLCICGRSCAAWVALLELKCCLCTASMLLVHFPNLSLSDSDVHCARLLLTAANKLL